MKKSLIYILLMLALPSGLFGQVNVTGSTGADGSYTTLGLAFSAINGTPQTGNNILIALSASTAETSTAVLRSGTWISVQIYPTIAGIIITGNLAAPLIDINGANNVTIDGRVNGLGTAKDLVIVNTNNSTSSATSTIHLINGASKNNIRYCVLKGSATGAASGILFFGISNGTTGNDLNIIDNNDITCSTDANRPINGIYSSGTATIENSENIISNNNFYNILNRAVATSVIYLTTNNKSWTISGNSFYESAPFVPSANVAYFIIRINNAGGDYSLVGNFIGGNTSFCGGLAWTKTNDFDNTFYGIYLYAGKGTPNNIQNNTIRNIDWSNSLNATWTGIYIESGDANVGTTEGNVIGDSTGTGSILLTCKNISNSVYGINIVSPGTVNCINNSIGSITLVNDGTNASNFYGINKSSSSGTTNISNNIIGSASTPNSINANSASSGNAQAMRGIYNAGTGIITINKNTIANLTNGTTNSTIGTLGKINGIFSSSGTNTISDNLIHDLNIGNANNLTNLNTAVCGIALSGSSRKTITGNTIYNLSNTYPTYTGSVIGLFFNGNTEINTISGNFIYSLSVNASATNASIFGIRTNTGSSIYSNNIITLGGNTASTIYGIYESGLAGSFNNLYYNTVSICGSPTSGSNKSYALYSATNVNIRDFRNNIFANTRSTSGGTNLHYAIYIVSSGGTIRCDYNDYLVSGTGEILGYYGANKSALPIVTGQDASSISADPLFATSCGTAATDYIPAAQTIIAEAGTGITTDYVGKPRDPDNPSMGAFEIPITLNVEVYQANVLQARYIRLKDAFDAFNSGIHNTGDFEIRIKGNVNEISTALLDSSGTGSANYSSVLIFPTKPGISVTGSMAAPLIDLNGADRVTIDGRVNATGAPDALAITNTSIADTSITSTIRMINSATNNIVRYCTLKGSATGTGSGILLIAASTGTSGNNGNIIENNNITGPDNINRPLNVIYSEGTATYQNSRDTIRNNNIYDFISPRLSSSGINLGLNTTAWSISGNSFYETAPFVPSAAVIYEIINISGKGNNYNISGNYIGGSAPQCGGSSWTKTNAFNNSFYGIFMNAKTGTPSNIQNNVIQNIDWSNSLNGSWTGMYIAGGDVNIGGEGTGNTIGAATGTGSISVNSKTTNNNVYGIYIVSTGTVNCLNNNIGSITLTNADANSSNFYGIYKASTAGTLTISRNTIGSTATAGSIISASHSTGNAQSVRGIYNTGTGSITISADTVANMTNATTNASVALTGKINGIFSSSGTSTISDNVIRDLTIANANNASGLNASVCGISLSGPTVKNVTANTIFNLSNTNPSFTGYLQGLFFMGSTGGNTVSRNFINSLSLYSSSGTIYGIQINTGTTTWSDNIISLKSDIGVQISGIYETVAAGNNNNFYFNTLYIGGSPVSGSQPSYALYSNSTTNIRNIRNNIFVNARSNNGSSGKHYAIRIAGTANLTIDYNDYYVSGNGGVLGYLGSDLTTFAAWQTATSQDINSQAIDPLFTGTGNIPGEYIPAATLIGVNGTGISVDFGLNPRAIPSMGAWEGNINKWKGTVSDNWGTNANWTAGIVPGPDANIFFDPAPLNHCRLDRDRSVTNINDSTGYRIIINGHKLTIKGNFYFSGGTKIDATATSSTIDFAGISQQTISGGQFLNNLIKDLIVRNTAGLAVNSDFTADNSLTINAGASLTMAAAKLLTVPGTLVNNGGNKGLVLKSDATGDSKLITGSSVPGTVELYLTGGLAAPAVGIFHYIVPPVQSMYIGATTDDVKTNLGLTWFSGDLLSYDEPSAIANKDAGWKYFDGYPAVGSPNFTDITSAEGYNIYLTNNDKLTFKGNLNSTTNTFTLDYTASNPNPGWNLVGNPFPCNFDLNGVAGLGTVVPGISNTVYYNNNGGYSYWNVLTNTGSTVGLTDILPPMTGFFVHVSQAGMSLSLPEASKTIAPSDSRSMHKLTTAVTTEKIPEIRKVKLVLSGSSKSDETIALLIDDAKNSYNEHYDAFKLSGKNTDGPQIFSLLNGTKYFMKAMPPSDTSAVVVPLRVVIGESGKHEIKITEFANLEGIKVTLRHGDNDVLLSPDATYSFIAEAGTYDNFELIFGDNTKVKGTVLTDEENMKAWYRDKYLYIFYAEDAGSDNARMIIYDYQGNMVYNNRKATLLPEQINQINVSLSQGFYIADIEIGGKHHRLKFVVY